MKILITQSIKGIGRVGEIKDFPQGYAQNFIIKKGYGIVATNEAVNKNLKDKERKFEEERYFEESLVKAVSELNDRVIDIKTQANEYGVLFSGISKKDILLELKKLVNAPLTEDMLVVKDTIKSVGEYSVEVKYKIYSSLLKVIVNKK